MSQTKKQKLVDYIIKNFALDDPAFLIDLSNLDFGNRIVILSNLKAHKIINQHQKANYIINSNQKSRKIDNSFQKGEYVNNSNQKAKYIFNSKKKEGGE